MRAKKKGECRGDAAYGSATQARIAPTPSETLPHSQSAIALQNKLDIEIRQIDEIENLKNSSLVRLFKNYFF